MSERGRRRRLLPAIPAASTVRRHVCVCVCVMLYGLIRCLHRVYGCSGSTSRVERGQRSEFGNFKLHVSK